MGDDLEELHAIAQKLPGSYLPDFVRQPFPHYLIRSWEARAAIHEFGAAHVLTSGIFDVLAAEVERQKHIIACLEYEAECLRLELASVREQINGLH